MAAAAVEILYTVTILIGFAGVIVALFDYKWEVQDLETTSSPATAQYRGLWYSCIPENSGNSNCRPYQSFFVGLETKLQAGRALTITALVLGFFSLVLCFFSLSAISCSSDNPAVRNRMRWMVSLCALFAGIAMLASSSWYASDILREYYLRIRQNPEYTRMVFGEAIFIGWAASAFLVFGGIIAGCISCLANDQSEEDYLNQDVRNQLKMCASPRKIPKEYV